ncbi:MAG: dephospho-CoA kinase [Gammaproteobacteria bacterium]|nr:dephospho-CoA kinase [Gammaproteobacteria bacterium]
MLIVGLTGGIGSGKTTVANYFEKLGVPVIDTDVLARELVMSGQPALDELVQTFGSDIINIDGTLDRRTLRQQVFVSTEKRKQLEAILHPRIRDAVRNQLANLSTDYCIIVIPLLFEAKQGDLVQRILVVDCDEQQQVDRTQLRDKVEKSDVEHIMATQAERSTRLSKADDIIHNTSSIQELQQQVEILHDKYLQLAQGC